MLGPPDYLGPGVIANRLNEANPDLPSKFTHVNIINFRDSLGRKALKVMDRQEVEETFIDPLKEVRGEMKELREKVLPKFKKAIARGDPAELRTFTKTYMDLFDRFAKLEHIIEPRAEMKVKYMQVNQQFDTVMAELMEAWRDFCPDCQKIMTERVTKLREPKRVITVEPIET